MSRVTDSLLCCLLCEHFESSLLRHDATNTDYDVTSSMLLRDV